MITTRNSNMSQAVNAVVTPDPSTQNQQSVTSASKSDKPHSVWFWLGLFVVFLGWGWTQNHGKVESELKPANLRANIHNLAVITLAAVVGIVGGKILFVKLAAVSQKIPLLGRGLAYMAQLFGAA